ncbi:hypothetical protein BH11PLA1_BH11PLA1_19500 [soil metagenome]
MNAPTPSSSQPLPTPALDARGLPVGTALKPDWEVTPRSVRDIMQRPAAERPILLDVRRDEEFAHSRIAGAEHIPLADLEKRAADLEDDAGARTRPIITYCHHGVRSLKAAATLRAIGYVDVRSMAGGIDLWSLDIDPKVPRY